MSPSNNLSAGNEEFVRRVRSRSIKIICAWCAVAAGLGAFGGIDSAAFFIHHLVLSVIFVTGFVLNHFGKLLWSTRFITIATTLWIVETSIGFGEELGLQNFLVIALVAVSLFYSQGYYRIISVITIIVLAGIIHVYQRLYPPVFDLPAGVFYFSLVNVVMPLVTISIICWNIMAEALARQALIEQQRAALQEAVEFKDKVFSIIGHDLRTPFNSAKSLISLIESGALTEEETKETIGELGRSVDVSLQTLDNILGWASQGYYGSKLNMKSKMEPVDLYALAERITALFAQAAAAKQITLVNDIQPGTYVEADLEQISFVLRNLASNALKFSFEGQAVVFSARNEGDRTIVSVTDNGTGMTEDMVASLFKITSRFSKEGTTNEKGTGLGLILCKEFVENNDGVLWLESEPNKGTRVSFSLKRSV